MILKRISLSFLLFLAVAACKPQFLAPADLRAYISDEDNGLKKTIKLKDTQVTVLYRPTDLLVYQEIGDDTTNAAKIRELRTKYDQNLYFILSLSTASKESLHLTTGSQYSDLVQTLSFQMSEYVSMTTAANDTIPVADFILNRTYGMSNSTDLLFVFDKDKAKGKDWVQFNLNEFGLGMGNQRFRFNVKDLDEVPEIQFAGVLAVIM
jgi:hypothetical protein